MAQRVLVAAAAAFACVSANTAQAETLKFAFQGTLNALDPYSLNETFTLSALGNAYEGLTRRGADLEIEPALAERWEVIEPNRWRFYLREGVKFHNGNDFTAEDVAFSVERVRSEGSDLLTRIGSEVTVEIVDDHTIDFVLPGPNPILHYEWDTFYIMDKEWTEENDAVKVTSASDTTPNYAALNANGTGPFKIVSHEPGVKTVYETFDGWWDDAPHNLTSVEFTPIGSDATRVAALLSGELDMVYPVPVQDIKRVDSNSGTRALTGPELRTIHLGMDQMRDELLYSDVKGKNPFKDIRVRKAFYQAIDIEAIKAKVMRDLATPASLLISPFLYGRADEFERYPYDVDAAKALMSEAGYPDGFTVSMDCPNDRYVNDEAICQAVAAMLARINVKVDLVAQPKAKYFAKVLASGGYDTSFYLLGWTPGSFDSWNILENLVQCRDDSGAGGAFNLGGYCNAEVDALKDKILSENDPEIRDELIYQAYAIANDEVSHIPLHQQGLAWGVSDKLELVQRADNQFKFRFVTKN
ncbi:peptide/nickel transport system substrate-binding protein [Roseibium hamelinense]|uniref:Peptide/nickel transport system substrate-binding protein n=1 Tax=Roseibium hamelinense TaxID=150831 RepID=A0A562SNP6_9HYPH|nr:ABC transporter substrate-binding protein [Roseibium hamelinense]MTI44287.1 ABC transporter substrate-binding protein [Roseibium hamelinense]TWI82939.1 peptide/nickel transport system substrate-binding protein [Roseibium hamelinense]